MNTTLAASTISVRTGARSGYDVCYETLEHVPGLMVAAGLRQGACLVVSDETVASIHGARIMEAMKQTDWSPHLITVPAGEASKSSRHLNALYDEAFGVGLDRRTPLLALGGGVVGDLAGFAAATLLRGIPLVHLPTTLVAQVDSSIGGKTGINHRFGKNLIGAFHQPSLVVSDLSTLATLSDRDWASGLAEVVKHSLISDAGLVDYLRSKWDNIVVRGPEAVAEMVPRATRVKIRVVEEDERETGARAHLNFGHTFGHAIERVAGYGAFTHGEAVRIGMQAALFLSKSFEPTFPLEIAMDLVRRIPVVGSPADLSFPDLVEAMSVDKKSIAGTIRFVLLNQIGKAYVRSDVSVDRMREAWESTMLSFARQV